MDRNEITILMNNVDYLMSVVTRLEQEIKDVKSKLNILASYADCVRSFKKSNPYVPPMMKSPQETNYVRTCVASPNIDERRCYNCGRNGHLASKCFRPTKCFACNNFGHISYNCSNIHPRKYTDEDFSKQDTHFDEGMHVGTIQIDQSDQTSNK